MDGQTPPPALFGISPNHHARPPADDGQRAPSAGIRLSDAAHGALIGAVMVLPEAQRANAVSTISALVCRAIKEHFAGFEDAIAMQDCFSTVQEIYLTQALKGLATQRPSQEAIGSLVRSAYGRHRGAKDEVLRIISQMPTPGAGSRNAVQLAAAREKSALLVGLIGALSTEEATPHYSDWQTITMEALGALRRVLQGVLAKMAQQGGDVAQAEVARIGVAARAAIIRAVTAQFLGACRYSAPSLVRTLCAAYGLPSPTITEQATMRGDQAFPQQSHTGGAEQRSVPRPQQAQPRPRPQVGNLPRQDQYRPQGQEQRAPALGQGGHSPQARQQRAQAPTQQPLARIVAPLPTGMPPLMPIARAGGAFAGVGR